MRFQKQKNICASIVLKAKTERIFFIGWPPKKRIFEFLKTNLNKCFSSYFSFVLALKTSLSSSSSSSSYSFSYFKKIYNQKSALGFFLLITDSIFPGSRSVWTFSGSCIRIRTRIKTYAYRFFETKWTTRNIFFYSSLFNYISNVNFFIKNKFTMLVSDKMVNWLPPLNSIVLDMP